MAKKSSCDCGKEHGKNTIDQKALAHNTLDFIKELRNKGFGDDISIVVVVGDRESQSVAVVPIMAQGFEHPTIMSLDKLVSEVKVNGMPNRSNSNVVITDENGKSTFLDDLKGNPDQRKEMGNFLLGEMKGIYDAMLKEKGEKKGRMDFLRNVVHVLSRNIQEWNEIGYEKKIDLLNDIINTTKNHENGEWFPHYENHEILAVIDEINHLTQFGYERKDTNNDVAFG